MTLTLESVIAILTALATLVGVYINLNEKITRQDEKIKSLESKDKEKTKSIEDLGKQLNEQNIQISKSLTDIMLAINNLRNDIKNLQEFNENN